MKDFFEKHYRVLMLAGLFILLTFFGFSQLREAIFPNSANISEEVITALIGNVLDKRVSTMEESLTRIERQLTHADDFSIILLTLEMNTFRTAIEVDERIDYLIENKWNAQLAALRFIAKHPEALEDLEKQIVYEEVFLALKKRIMSF